MRCPHCRRKINMGTYLARFQSPAKAAAARRNGKLGGRPRKRWREHVKTAKQN